MPRLAPVDPDRLSPRQKTVRDAILAGPRAGLAGPFAWWLHRPEMADPAQQLGQFCRFDSSLPKRLSELGILVVARFWNAEFEWWAHKGMALDAGLDPAIVDAIRDRREPAFAQEDEAAVHAYASMLMQDRKVTDAVYDRAVSAIGTDGVLDLNAILGYYCLVSITLNVFEVPIPEGETPEMA